MADVSQLSGGNVLETFSAGIEVFVDLDGRFLHDGVGVLAASTEEEVLPARDPSVTIVVVQPHAQERGRLLLGFTPVRCSHNRISLTQGRGIARMLAIASRSICPGRGSPSTNLETFPGADSDYREIQPPNGSQFPSRSGRKPNITGVL